MSLPWYSTAFGAHYRVLYGHRDEAEARQCLDLLPRLAPLDLASPLLDLGCGDGRHLRQLAGQGLPVVGLDLSPHLLAAASCGLGGIPTPLVRGDMRQLPFVDNCFGSVLSLFTAFGYFGNLADNAPVVREVARVLRPGGHWYLDYVDCDSVRRELADGRQPVRRREIGPLAVTETRRLARQDQLVEKIVNLIPRQGLEIPSAELGVGPGGLVYTEQVALFTRSEMEDLALASDLAPVACAGSYEGLSVGEGNRWIMVFRKMDQARVRQDQSGV